MAVNWLIIGAIAIVIVLLILGALDRWNVFGDDRENTDSGTDRVKQEARREGDYSVSWMKKHKTLTVPAKVVTICMGLIMLSTGVYVYFVLKSGAPVEVPYANAIRMGAIAVGAVFAGSAYRGSKESNRGRLDIVYEDDDGDDEGADTIWFDPSETTTDTSGNLIVYEHFPNRILGLFGRRKLVAHDRELRTERSVLSDVVAHQVPRHAVEIDTDHYQFRTQGQVTSAGVSSAADYRYRSPIQLPYTSYMQQRERIEKLQMRLGTKDAILGEAQTRLHELERRLENYEFRDQQAAREEIKEILKMMPARRENIEIRQDRNPQRMARDGVDLDDLQADGAGVDS